MRAGLLRHRITFQTPTKTQNSYGEEDWVWNDDVVMWSEIMPMRGTEYHFTRQAKSEITHRIRMRYTTLDDGSLPSPENCRIKYFDHKTQTERIFDVQSVKAPFERFISLEIMCIEVS